MPFSKPGRNAAQVRLWLTLDRNRTWAALRPGLEKTSATDPSAKLATMKCLVRPSCLAATLLALAGCASEPAAAPKPPPPAPLEAKLVQGKSSPLLDTVVPAFAANDAPLAQVIDDLSRQTGVILVANYPAMELAGVDRNTQVRLSAPRALPLGQVLDLLLGQAGGGFVELVKQERDGVVTITTRQASTTADRQVGVYPVTALLADMRKAAEVFPDAPGNAATRPNFDASDFGPAQPRPAAGSGGRRKRGCWGCCRTCSPTRMPRARPGSARGWKRAC